MYANMNGQMVSAYTFSGVMMLLAIFFLILSAWTLNEVNTFMQAALSDYANFVKVCKVDPFDIQRLQMFTYFTLVVSVMMIIGTGFSLYSQSQVPRNSGMYHI